MPLPIIANVFRVTLDWARADGIAPRNVIHVEDPAHGRSEGDVGTAIGAQLGAIGHQFDCVSSLYVLGSVNVLKLDGSSASVNVPFSATSGQASGDVMPAVAGVLSLRTDQRGPQGRGRLYLGPMGEGVQSAGVLSPTVVSAMATAWETFRTNLGTLTPPLPWVVASYKHAVARDILSVTMDSLVGTQRRRQDQLR